MQGNVKKLSCLLLAAALALFLYVLLHELGHLIVMLSAGATITGFSIFTAHVSAVGGNYSNLSDLWLHANGAVLPVMVSLTFMLFYQSKAKSMLYHMFIYIFCLASVFSLLAWVAIPFAYMLGNAPVGDDVTNFLLNFAQTHHPLIVSAAALLIIAAGVAVMIRKGIISTAISIMRER